MSSQLADELTFGEWWLTSAEDVSDELNNSTPAEGEFITRTLLAFTSLDGFSALPQVSELRAAVSCWLAEAGTEPSESILRLSAGEYVPPPPWHRSTSGDDMKPIAEALNPDLTEVEIDELIEAIAVAAEITGRDLWALGTRLSSKWRLAESLAGDALARIARALEITVPIVVADAPPVVRGYVDQAMFVPAPFQCGYIMYISPNYRRVAATDPFAAARLLLAAAHEIAGHAVDFHDFVSNRPAREARWLDRELLEGWGIVAEARLSVLGTDERALHLLYKAKRLLPLAYRSLEAQSWQRVRVSIERSWPGYFEAPETAVLRRATGTHARGLVRVQRALRAWGTQSRRRDAHPWQAPYSGMDRTPIEYTRR